MRSRSSLRSILLGVGFALGLIGTNGVMGAADGCSEPHDSIETACSIGGDGMQLVRSAITSLGGRNVYAIKVAQPGSQLSVWLEDLPFDYDLDLVTENGDIVDQSAAEGLLPEALRQSDLGSGEYFVIVKSYAGLGFDAGRTYALYVQLVAPEVPVLPEPTAIPLPTAIPVPSVTPTPRIPTFTIFFSLDPSTGWPSGYVRDPNGVVRNFGTGNTTDVVVRFGDRIVLEAGADRFSMLFDCGPSNPSVTPCNFNASSKGELPAEIRVINRDPVGGFISISSPNHYGGDRPGFPGQKYVTDPKTTIFVNPNPR